MARENNVNDRKIKKEDEIWQDIREIVHNLSYGSLTITVHDGKIVQTETSSKVRY